MSDILDEAYGIAQCKGCPWYKACVTPMRFTVEDIRRQLQNNPGAMGMPPGQDMNAGIQDFLGSMASAAQNSLLEGCPVFIQRLRSDEELARRIKKLMQDWGQDSSNPDR